MPNMHSMNHMHFVTGNLYGALASAGWYVAAVLLVLLVLLSFSSMVILLTGMSIGRALCPATVEVPATTKEK